MQKKIFGNTARISKSIKILSVLVAIAIVVIFLQKKHIQKKMDNQYNKIEITSEIFKVENGFGYKIFYNNKLYIVQETIPAVSGNFSFQSEKDALNVSQLVVEKIKNGIIPPTVTIEELKNMGIE